MTSFQQKIFDFAPWTIEQDLSQQIVLCMDHSSLASNHFSGEFLLICFLLKLSQTQIKNAMNNQSIVIFLTNHNRNHYETIFRKNSIDLKQLEIDGKIVFVYLYATNDDKLMIASSTSGKKGDKEVNCLHFTWDELVSWQKEGMNWPHPTIPSKHNKIIIMINDLEMFEMLSPTFLQARMFVHELLQCLENEEKSNNMIDGFIAYGRCSQEEVLEFPNINALETQTTTPYLSSKTYLSGLSTSLHSDGQVKLTDYLRYRTTISVLATPLKTGYSTTTHGIITVDQVITQPSYARNHRVLQYKALDSGVYCTSSGDGWK